MTPPALEQTQRLTRTAIQRLVAAGLLERNGYWHRLLGDDALPCRGNRIVFWSGFLVKPAPGVALRVSGAFNRRSRIAIGEQLCDELGLYVNLITSGIPLARERLEALARAGGGR